MEDCRAYEISKMDPGSNQMPEEDESAADKPQGTTGPVYETIVVNS